MNLLLLTVCSGVLVVVVRLVALPCSQLAASIAPSPSSIPRIAFSSACGVLNAILIVAAISTALSWALLFVLTNAGLRSVQRLASAGEVVQGIREWAAVCSKPLAIAVLARLLLVLVVLAHWAGKRRIEGVFRQRYEEEAKRLDTAFKRGEWEVLPDTPELNQIDEQIGELRKVLTARASEVDVGRAIEHMERLYALRYVLDRARRVDLRVDQVGL